MYMFCTGDPRGVANDLANGDQRHSGTAPAVLLMLLLLLTMIMTEPPVPILKSYRTVFAGDLASLAASSRFFFSRFAWALASRSACAFFLRHTGHDQPSRFGICSIGNTAVARVDGRGMTMAYLETEHGLRATAVIQDSENLHTRLCCKP